MMPHHYPLRAVTGDRVSEPARPRTLPPLTRAAWRWLCAPVVMLIDMWAEDPEYLADAESARDDEGAASDTCSGGGRGTPSPEPFGRKLGRFVCDFIGAASLFITLFILLFLGSAIQ
ncbi:MAG: hypothetical protein AB7S99_20035 [Pseudodonghicola sp.]